MITCTITVQEGPNGIATQMEWNRDGSPNETIIARVFDVGLRAIGIAIAERAGRGEMIEGNEISEIAKTHARKFLEGEDFPL